MTARVAVVGAAGFIGRAVRRALDARGIENVALRAPRLTCDARVLDDVLRAAEFHAGISPDLTERLRSVTHLVNCAGVSAAGAAGPHLFGANSLLPALLGQAATNSGISRFVHVSSSSVQGDMHVLSEQAEYEPFSPYTQSKVWAEQALSNRDQVILYRPTSVHGMERPVTQSLARIARSSFASVAGAGDAPSPQVLVENVADAVCHLLLSETRVPMIVMHPSEGMTTAKVLTFLGGKQPRRVAMPVALGLMRLANAMPAHPLVLAQRRRLKMLWFGQSQEESWLTGDGWSPLAGDQAWRELGAQLGARRAR